MQLEKIISISGKPGLFKLVSQLKNGFIIEDITTKKKMSISNSSQVSLLDNISMFTTNQEVPLFEVFENIAKGNEYSATIPHKSTDDELRQLMETALPKYDRERVYVSDIKKLAQWYNTLHKAGYITKDSFVKNENPEEPVTLEKEKAPKSAPKTEKSATPKAKASTASKAAPKSAPRKQG